MRFYRLTLQTPDGRTHRRFHTTRAFLEQVGRRSAKDASTPLFQAIWDIEVIDIACTKAGILAALNTYASLTTRD